MHNDMSLFGEGPYRYTVFSEHSLLKWSIRVLTVPHAHYHRHEFASDLKMPQESMPGLSMPASQFLGSVQMSTIMLQ